jgi:xylulokinase
MSKQLILAHDLGTSSDKASIFSLEGEFLAEANASYDTHYSKPGYAEHNPEDWWVAVKESTKEVIRKAGIEPDRIKAISFSAHGMGVIPIDKQGNVLTEKTMVWMDTRATKEAEEIQKHISDRKRYELSGAGFALPMYPFAKVAWIKNNLPDVYKKTYKILSTKEFLIMKMTGQIGLTCYLEAGLSGAFNLREHKYDEDLLSYAGIDGEKLLKPAVPTTVAGELTSSAAAEMGLKEGTPVVLGSWDNFACATGGNVMKKGTFVTYLGTAGWVATNADKPLMSDDFEANIVYAGDNNYFTLVNSNSACAAYEWILNNACEYLKTHPSGKDMFAMADELAASVEAGSDEMFFMPSMMGGNTFFADAKLKGSLLGLKMQHTNAHIIRAAMEGVGFDLMLGSEYFAQMNLSPTEVRLIGGGANSAVWRKILSSMFGLDLTRPKKMQHIGSMGAAMMAAVGTGLADDFSIVEKVTTSDDWTRPNWDDHKTYKAMLPTFKGFYEALIPAYKNLK